MSLLLSHRYWSRADAPGRTQLLAELAKLQPGQRLRLADVIKGMAPTDGAEAEAGERADTVPPLLADYTSTALRGKAIDPETRETELSFSSEEPYERWWGVEILGHKSGEVDLGWMASGRAPFLSNHRTGDQIGVVTRAWLDTKTGRGKAVCRFGRSELAEQEFVDAQDDVRVNVSVGYEIRELELVKKDGDTSTYRVTDWLPLECSLVSIPADMTVGIGRSVDAETPAPALPATPRETRKEHTVTTNTEKPLAGDEKFQANVATIQRLAKSYGQWLKPTDVADAIANGADGQKFNDLIMERMQAGAVDATSMSSLGVTQKEGKKYSFLRAIQMQIPGAGIDAGFEREVSQAIARATGREAEGCFIPAEAMFAGLHGRAITQQQRDFLAGTSSQAGNLIQTTVDASMWTDVLRPAMILAALGVTILPGLRGNLAVPRKTVAGTLAMLTEVAAASETEPTTALPTLSPKRAAAFTEPSKQAIIQGEIGIEAMIRQDLLDGVGVLIESQGINGSGSSPNARGIRNVSGIGSVVGGTNGAALAWSHVVDLEAATANVNAADTARAGYLLNSKTVGKAKQTLKAAGLPFIWDMGDRPLNGQRAGITNNVPSNLTKGTASGTCSSMVFSSDWSMFVLGLFGGQDVTVDPYTLATTGQVRITLNQFFDWLCRQPGAFASSDDIVTG